MHCASLIIVASVFAGCGGTDPGPPRVPVAGQVSLDGTPLRTGSIRFVPTGQTKGPAAVAAVKDGLYELTTEDGPVVGTHRVEIEALDYRGFDLDDEQAAVRKVAEGKPLPKNPIPVTYNTQSRLSVQVPSEGNPKLDFPLNSKGTPIKTP